MEDNKNTFDYEEIEKEFIKMILDDAKNTYDEDKDYNTKMNRAMECIKILEERHSKEMEKEKVKHERLDSLIGTGSKVVLGLTVLMSVMKFEEDNVVKGFGSRLAIQNIPKIFKL